MTYRIQTTDGSWSREVRVEGHTDLFTEWYLERERLGLAEVWGVSEKEVTVEAA